MSIARNILVIRYLPSLYKKATIKPYSCTYTGMDQSYKDVRVRFAPSPTGYLHVGGLRTALYNYLFAKKHEGTFILRIEDTDQKRFVSGSAESLIQTLGALGMQYNEGPFLKNERTGYPSEQYSEIVEVGECGPYIQSERLNLYKKYADELIESGQAYYCFCSAERLEQVRADQVASKQASRYDRHCLTLSPEERAEKKAAGVPYVIRFRVPDNREIIFDDLVRGTVRFHTHDTDDQVLLKSDGFPTYHLAVVVDDHLMQITHVLRAEEWLPSTPKHILLYEAFGWEAPHFAHIPLLLNPDKSKLSKRQGDVAVEDYLKKGYLKEALVNFVALLGWNPGQGSTQEIFSLEELSQVFNLSTVHKAGAVFDLKKLDWMNAEYIKKLPIEHLYEATHVGNFFHKPLIEDAPATMHTPEYLKKVLSIEQDRLVKLSDVGENNPFFFSETLSYDATLLNWKENSAEVTKETLERSLGILTNLSETDWETRDVLEKILMDAAGEKRGDFLWPLRVALTGAQRSPSPFDCAWVLGKEISLNRIRQAIVKLA